MESTFTLRDPPATYMKIQVAPGRRTSNAKLDEVTVKTYLNAALTQYLGLTGVAIAIDIFKTTNDLAWIRVLTEDESLVVAALSQWSGNGGTTLRVQNRSAWLGALTDSDHENTLWSLES